MGKIIRNGINYSSTTDAAKNINYDNSASGLAATTAQKAIDELNRKIAAGGGGSSSNIIYLTQAEYDALPEDKLEDNIEYWITDAGVRGSAENVSYDASASGLDAKNVQEAVDKLAEGAGNKVEYLTQEEYDALPEDKLTNNVEYRILDSGTPTTARNIGYDGTASGIDAINVQGAIDNLKEDVSTLTESLGESISETISTPYGNINVRKNGRMISIYGVLRGLPSGTSAIKINLPYSVNVAVLHIYKTGTPYPVVGTIWVYSNAEAEIYKQSDITEGYVYGCYVSGM